MTLRRLLCLVCRAESSFEEEDLDTVKGCPACGNSVSLPADLDETVTITLTVHELRILTYWATNWALMVGTDDEGYDGKPVIRGITDHLAQYTSAALSITQDIADLRAAGYEVYLVDADDGSDLEEG